MRDSVQAKDVMEARRTAQRLCDNIAKVIRGKEAVIEHVTICLIAGGHLLIEDLPGLGKTTLAYALARSLNGTFSRIQFTSDLLPSDVTGVSIYDELLRQFVFKAGPIFANVVLADEINRATPKTQSSLLEVMDRGRVTVDGVSHPVGTPFMVFATQNPVDNEGTFPLPDSQMDRFLMRLPMGYPDPGHELQILRGTLHAYDHLPIEAVVEREELLRLQAMAADVFVEDSILEFVLKLVTATRTETEFKSGISVRGALSLKSASQARALIHGRDFVVPEDVVELAEPVLSHRLALNRSAGNSREERTVVTRLLKRILSALPLPV